MAAVALTVVVTLALVLAGGAAYVYVMQDRAVFPGAWMDLGTAGHEDNYPGAERVEMEVSGGAVLRGWFIRSPESGTGPLVMYFGGNAEDATANAQYFQDMMRGWSVLLVNYRGFGQSTGRPSEETILKDALALYDRFSSRPDVMRGRIVVMGRSLGTGVAVHLASRRQVEAVVLVSPYDTLVSLARRFYPAVPRVLLRHRFDSMDRAPGVTAPALVLIADRDVIIPPDESLRLADSLGGPVEVRRLSGAGHNDIYAHPGFRPALQGFLDSFR